MSQRTELATSGYTPGQVKRVGGKLELRFDWEEVKLTIMEELVRIKFQIPTLTGLLIQTGNAELVEGNYWNDTYWGVCKDVGENHLGKILMKVRNKLAIPEIIEEKFKIWFENTWGSEYNRTSGSDFDQFLAYKEGYEEALADHENL